VAHKVGPRVEVDDTVIVRATDASAIAWIGFRVDTGAAGHTVEVRYPQLAAFGNLTDVTRRASLNLGSVMPPVMLPHSIVVRGYACDRRRRATARTRQPHALAQRAPEWGSRRQGFRPEPVAERVDRHGDRRQRHHGSAAGSGQHRRRDLQRQPARAVPHQPGVNRVDVFQVANTTFVAAGSRRAGGTAVGHRAVAADTMGNYKDTIVVADVGGTQLASHWRRRRQ